MFKVWGCILRGISDNVPFTVGSFKFTPYFDHPLLAILKEPRISTQQGRQRNRIYILDPDLLSLGHRQDSENFYVPQRTESVGII